jgi:hypothetical protein
MLCLFAGMHSSEPENPNPDDLKILDPDPIIADPYARSASLKDLSGSTNSMLAFRSRPSGSVAGPDPGSGAFLIPESGKGK